MRKVTFVLTTARSGTQWLTSQLNRAFGDLLVARHEPVGYLYRPRETLRDPAKLGALHASAEVRAHFDMIRSVLEDRGYVETGFPAFALAPVLRAEFGDRLRLVQLTRHPVHVAASLVTHGWYCDGRRDDIARAVALTPFDPGVTLGRYAERWPRMSAFEKGLFYWHEVHSFAAEVEAAAPPAAFARFRFEDLVGDGAARDALRRFLELPARDAWADAGAARVDRFRRWTGVAIDPAAIRGHPEILALARRLGYEPEDVDQAALASRYGRGPLRMLGGGLRRVRRLFRSGG